MNMRTKQRRVAAADWEYDETSAEKSLRKLRDEVLVLLDNLIRKGAISEQDAVDFRRKLVLPITPQKSELPGRVL